MHHLILCMSGAKLCVNSCREHDSDDILGPSGACATCHLRAGVGWGMAVALGAAFVWYPCRCLCCMQCLICQQRARRCWRMCKALKMTCLIVGSSTPSECFCRQRRHAPFSSLCGMHHTAFLRLIGPSLRSQLVLAHCPDDEGLIPHNMRRFSGSPPDDFGALEFQIRHVRFRRQP